MNMSYNLHTLILKNVDLYTFLHGFFFCRNISISKNVTVDIEILNNWQRTMETFYKYHSEVGKSVVKP